MKPLILPLVSQECNHFFSHIIIVESFYQFKTQIFFLFFSNSFDETLLLALIASMESFLLFPTLNTESSMVGGWAGRSSEAILSSESLLSTSGGEDPICGQISYPGLCTSNGYPANLFYQLSGIRQDIRLNS